MALHQRDARGMDADRIHRRFLRRQFVLGGRHQHLGGEGGIFLGPRQHIADGGDIIAIGVAARAARHSSMISAASSGRLPSG